MLYNKFGVYVGDDDHSAAPSEWRMEDGYRAYGVSDICVGAVVQKSDGKYYHVVGIREVVNHTDDRGALCYIALYEDGSQEFLKHYGTPRHSGRYPWGSGENPYQRNADFLGQVYKMRQEKGPDGKRLFTDTQIAATMNMNSSEFRKRISLANAEIWAYKKAEYDRLKAKGMSRSAIARRMGEPESTLRNWDNESVEANMTRNAKAAKILRDRVKDVEYVQVGAGAEYFLGNMKSTSLNNTLHMLEKEGYQIHNIDIDQLGTGKKTTVKVLTSPGVTKNEVYKNLDKIHLPVDIYQQDEEVRVAKPYVSVDPKRVQVCYAEEGGKEKDGLIEIRRGVKDLDLGRNVYAQGRILVDNDHYLKGMIAYADDLPDGIDIRFNTNKHVGTPMINREDKNNSVLKPIKADQENIFGANIKPDEKLMRANRYYIDDDGTEKQSAINIVKEEGDVDAWTKSLASQFLSKQPPELAKKQLKLTYDIAKTEFEEIKQYNNPLVKAQILEDFAGRCDRDSVHLAAAALPRQKTKFILPLTNLKKDEAYVPGYEEGEWVALVRYPHAHISEIPIVRVHNKGNKQAEKLIGDAVDAIGISSATAERLSGADFDGDTVLVLPMKSANIASKPQMKALIGFDDKEAYPGYEGMTKMTKRQHGIEMGKVSNLITDMTIMGAPDEEIAFALKHSMVVVDAEKHGLDWKRSEIENHIPELKKKYQGGGGASTLLSRSTHEEHIPERKEKAPSKMTPEERARWEAGEMVYETTNRDKWDPKFPRRLMTKEEKVKFDSGSKAQVLEVKRAMLADGRAVRDNYKGVTEAVDAGYLHDPFELTSSRDRENARRIERIYGDYARQMKALANTARAEARAQTPPKVNKEAAKEYSKEVESLLAKVAIAERNRPLERQAQLLGNVKYRKWLWEHPEEDAEHRKRERGRILDVCRKAVGAKKLIIGSEENPLTRKEWEAIQAGALSTNRLRKVLDNADMTVVKQYAMPKTKTGMVPAKVSRAKSMLSNGYTRKEVCEMLEVSEKTLIDAIGLADI